MAHLDRDWTLCEDGEAPVVEIPPLEPSLVYEPVNGACSVRVDLTRRPPEGLRWRAGRAPVAVTWRRAVACVFEERAGATGLYGGSPRTRGAAGGRGFASRVSIVGGVLRVWGSRWCVVALPSGIFRGTQTLT